MSMRLVPSATLERICVSPRVNRAEPCTLGEMSTSHSIGRISSCARPSGRFLSTAMRRRMMSFSRASKARDTSVRRSGRLLACELLGDLGCLIELLTVRGLDLLHELGIHLGLRDLELLLTRFASQLLYRRADLLDLLVGDVQGVEDLGLADPIGAALDHQDRLAGPGDYEVHLELLVGLLRRVDHDVAVKLSDP